MGCPFQDLVTDAVAVIVGACPPSLSLQVLRPEVRCFYSKNLKCGSDFGNGQWTLRGELVKEESTFNMLCLLFVKFGTLFQTRA